VTVSGDRRAGEEFDAFGRCFGALSGVIDEEQEVGRRAPAPDDLDAGGCVLLRRDAGRLADAVEQGGERVLIGVGAQIPGGAVAVPVTGDG